MTTVLLGGTESFYFGNDWQSALDKFGINQFHASDFHGSRGEFRDWDGSRKAELESAIVELLLKWKVKHSTAFVVNDHYRESFVKTGLHKAVQAARNWKQAYPLAFRHTVGDLRQYSEDQDPGHYVVPVFDRCQEFVGESREYYNSRNADGKLGGMHVATADEYVQIQAADFLVWEYRVNAERCIETGDRDPGPVLGQLQQHIFSSKIWTLDYLEYLRERVCAAISGGDPETVRLPSPGPGVSE